MVIPPRFRSFKDYEFLYASMKSGVTTDYAAACNHKIAFLSLYLLTEKRASTYKALDPLNYTHNPVLNSASSDYRMD